MVNALPVIVGFGGYNAAGRSSSHQAFRRMVLESLSVAEQQQTVVSLACLMARVTKEGQGYRDASGQLLTAAEVDSRYRADIINGTLIRRIESFDPARVPGNKKISLTQAQGSDITFTMAKRDLPKTIPSDWQVRDLDDGTTEITAPSTSSLLVESYYELVAKSAGELPTGFNPSDHYNSRFHPRGLQMALLGASDAIYSLGIPWDKIANSVQPDEVGVYSSSVLSQMCDEGFGGLLQSRLKGNRTTAKQLPLGLNSMPADFINAYVLGSVGHTEAITGACASFLYVLQAAVRDIRSGRRRVAILGNAEAGVTPEIMEGFANMSALASEENLCKLDGTKTADWRRASRPFGDNCGFTLSEATQYIVLMDDALAMELGADIHGAVPDVFINADGVKKSISAPGVGNYISFSKAVATAISIVGAETVQKHSFVHAHGSSTPANRTTESELIDRVAQAFDIDEWPVTAIKAYVGHSLSTASGDQLVAALGTFKYDLIPGIKTITQVASDVHQQRARFPLQDLDVSATKMDVAFINSKGFGGNNATAVVLSPRKVDSMLAARYGDKFQDYLLQREKTRAAAADYAERADAAELNVIYRFGDDLINDAEVTISRRELRLPGFAQSVLFKTENPWPDMQ
ncbi:MAG: beta-ketoacyl synthase [Porticoccaceae bacterium]|jgi:acetoacetyl-[acyl-carrier protein] synthase|nr:MAG: beta-ketoacyl synthase [SAR92 bacterium BACL16 MAG-120619-bin48]KRP27062.1 MAG: beta-ketoacyl synthase [SAR92 bacterium BACL16 MAG-120322-bin99]MDP4654574.1 beta-ketoacyl synthase [Alphaproteobacteria bacterium]MDP4745096.1 beta-ketoacyl synthase [Porticoccaceae bacterium]MDP4753275.1 beta-ketoacyl synthase [Porticoccaceae bacterium]